MKMIPKNGAAATRMAGLLNQRVRLAFKKPKRGSWLGVELDFEDGVFIGSTRPYNSRDEAAEFVRALERKPRPGYPGNVLLPTTRKR